MLSSSVATGSAKSKLITLPGQMLTGFFGCNNTDKVAIKEKLERKHRCRIQLRKRPDAIEEKKETKESSILLQSMMCWKPRLYQDSIPGTLSHWASIMAITPPCQIEIPMLKMHKVINLCLM